MLVSRSVVAAFLLLLFAGCATNIPDVPTTHIVMFSGSGNLVDPTGNTACTSRAGLCKGKHSSLKNYVQLSSRDAARYRADLLADAAKNAPIVDGKRQLLLYVHGGLNTQVGTVKHAAGLYQYIAEEKDEKAKVYPIFVNWQSSWTTTYWDHIAHLRQGQFWPKAGYATLPLWVAGDLTRAIGHAPIDYFYEIKTQNDARKTSTQSKAIQAQAAVLASDTGLRLRVGEDVRGKREKFVGFLAQAAFSPPKLITAPLIDGLGTGAWNAMDHRTLAVFQTDREFESAGFPDPARQGGLAIFLRELADMINKNGGAAKWSVTLVGHSMGALIVNRMLDSYEELPIDRIVYLASASSIDDYNQSAVAYLLGHPQTRMYHLMLERHAEVWERFDGVTRLHLLFDAVPRGSLLVWIDNFLSKPTTILQRRVGRFSNFVRAVHDTPAGVARRTSVYVFDFGASVRKTQPQTHSEVGSIAFWRPGCLFSDGAYPPGCFIPTLKVQKSAAKATAVY